jgi:hypothetical protein
MLLLAMFSMLMVFIIPKMTAGLGTVSSVCRVLMAIDQQALDEYRAQQPTAPQLPSFDFASFMAGTSSKKPAAGQVEQPKKAK